MITILGPTATGKTTLAAHVALKLKGEVISADSRQVYKGMDLGTGKDIEEYEINGVKIFLDKPSEAYLSGTELDYADDLNGAGFVFKNPNAKRTCSCGDSFCA